MFYVILTRQRGQSATNFKVDSATTDPNVHRARLGALTSTPFDGDIIVSDTTHTITLTH